MKWFNLIAAVKLFQSKDLGLIIGGFAVRTTWKLKPLQRNLELFFIHVTVSNIIASGLVMLKNLISMPKMLIDVTLGDQQQRNLSMLLLRDFVMFVRRGTNVVASWRLREWNWISQ
ncbi:hypothetical protein HanLR1_Chr04g0127101 [Helianthus annuus]|nr:hypothetical protein HanHA89_Chr04g0135261 [Helianthus annuus]KAJ0756433.1 hypothetical protein HanLR1_Chr04g0127101 [Helianthus annuus]